MFDKRLTALCPESKKYIAGNIILQWIELCLNAVMIGLIAGEALPGRTDAEKRSAGYYSHCNHHSDPLLRD